MIARRDPSAITKADATALWHAVDALSYQVRAMKDIVPPLSDECTAQERAHLADAKLALRKVQALVRAARKNKTEAA